MPNFDLMVRLDADFRSTSGLSDRRYYKIFYSAIAPAPLLVLGFNPGGETDGTDLNASASFYENWEHDYVDFRGYGNAYKLAGRAYDTLAEVLQTSSSDAIRRIPATNVIFRRSRRSSSLDLTTRAAAHESAPVLAEILRTVDPVAILLLGSTAFDAFVVEHCVRGSLVVNAEPPELFKANGASDACMFRSAHAHVAALGRDVPLLMVGHLSKYYARHGVWRDVIASLRAELVRLGVSPLGGDDHDPVGRPTLSPTTEAADETTPTTEPAPQLRNEPLFRRRFVDPHPRSVSPKSVHSAPSVPSSDSHSRNPTPPIQATAKSSALLTTDGPTSTHDTSTSRRPLTKSPPGTLKASAALGPTTPSTSV